MVFYTKEEAETIELLKLGMLPPDIIAHTGLSANTIYYRLRMISFKCGVEGFGKMIVYFLTHKYLTVTDEENLVRQYFDSGEKFLDVAKKLNMPPDRVKRYFKKFKNNSLKSLKIIKTAPEIPCLIF